MDNAEILRELRLILGRLDNLEGRLNLIAKAKIAKGVEAEAADLMAERNTLLRVLGRVWPESREKA